MVLSSRDEVTVDVAGAIGPDSVNRTILAVMHQDNAGLADFAGVIAAAGYDLEIANYAAGKPPARAVADYAGIIILGGNPQVDQEDVHPWLTTEKCVIREILAAGVPFLGICLGAQLLAAAAGAEVRRAPIERRGWSDVLLCPGAEDDPIMGRMPPNFRTVVWHKYEFAIPQGATPLAMSTTSWQAFRCDGKLAWGLQYHPEANLSSVLGWIDMDRSSGGLTEHEVRYHSQVSRRYAPAQAQLAITTCVAFLDVVKNYSGS